MFLQVVKLNTTLLKHIIDKTKRTKVKTLIRKAKFKDSMLSIMYEFSPYEVDDCLLMDVVIGDDAVVI
jgi:hypothetical protein